MCVPKICVVDDDPDVLETLGTILRDAGLPVDARRSTIGYRPKFDELARTLFVLDLQVDGESGFSFIDRAQRIDPGFTYLVHSATATVSSATQLMKQNAFEIVEKPASPDDILATIHAGLERVTERHSLLASRGALESA